MKVFLTGATGYIGSAVASALLQAGHSVTGLARSDAAAAKLLAAGVQPVFGDLDNLPAITTAAKAADGVIHAAMEHSPATPTREENLVRTVIDALAGTANPLIYTSGVWVIGDTRGRVVAEIATLRPPAIVAWRPAVEKIVLEAEERRVRGVVLRPAMVYGRNGGILGGWVKQARETGTIRLVGNGENHWSFVYIDDVADAYVRALENAGPGEMFLLAHGPSYPTKTVAAATGAQLEFWPLDDARHHIGPVADALVLDQKIASTKAGRLLGWCPQGPDVLTDIIRSVPGS